MFRRRGLLSAADEAAPTLLLIAQSSIRSRIEDDVSEPRRRLSGSSPGYVRTVGALEVMILLIIIALPLVALGLVIRHLERRRSRQ